MSWWRAVGIGLITTLGTFGCGDNAAARPDGGVVVADAGLEGVPRGQPLVQSDRLIVVAHQDDDLLFMQPDLFEVVSAHRPVTVVYVTAGDGGDGVEYSESRNMALRFAYGVAGGSQAWSCGWIDVAGHAVQHCRLPEANVSLVFLGYPDGGVPGNFPNSLLHLWDGFIAGTPTIARVWAYYDRPGLIATVAQLITTTAPGQIWTQEISATHSSDHSDHMLVGALTLLAAASANTTAQVVSYRGYNVNYEPANLPAPLSGETSVMMRAYEACQTGCGACGSQPCETIPDPRYDAFAHRRYAVAMRQPPMTGLLQTAAGCASVGNDGSLVIASCSNASTFQFDVGGNVRVGMSCLVMASDATLSVGPCGPGPTRSFAFDEEGHLWAGVPPVPHAGMDYDHLLCVAPVSGRVSGSLCGADLDARWDLLQPPVVTPRPALAGGRAVRMGDITGDGWADLCAVQNSALMCAPGDGAGRFGSPVRVDSPDAPLDIDPATLVLGDVDGDGLTDACGNDSTGVVCATAASGFVTAPWTGALGNTVSDPSDDESLGLAAGALCQLDASGVACVPRGRKAAAIESTWPANEQVSMWPADIDGDGQPDWCVTTPSGPACGLAAEESVTTQGIPWGFSLLSVVDGSLAADGTVADLTHGALADVTGDGRADLCVALGGKVECAFSQGHGFGPRSLMLALPTGVEAAALWMGDLDGDGKADACVDDGSFLTCARSP